MSITNFCDEQYFGVIAKTTSFMGNIAASTVSEKVSDEGAYPVDIEMFRGVLHDTFHSDNDTQTVKSGRESR